MNAKGVSDEYLNNWVSSLTDRADVQKAKGVFAWGVFVARKPQAGELPPQSRADAHKFLFALPARGEKINARVVRPGE